MYDGSPAMYAPSTIIDKLEINPSGRGRFLRVQTKLQQNSSTHRHTAPRKGLGYPLIGEFSLTPAPKPFSSSRKKHPGARRFRKNLRELKLPAVPHRILTWRPAHGVDLIAVVTLEGGMTVFKLDPGATALRTVYHDGQAFPAGVVGVEEDRLHGEVVVLSAGVGEDLTWVVSRASSQWG